MSDRVVIVDYDPAWPDRFERARDRLRGLLPESARIEHVGSTAVPGLAAKPILDLLVGVARLAEFEACLGALESDGWHYVPEHEAVFPERRFLAKPEARPRTHHLHAVEIGTPFWNDHLAFRDHLRRHASAAAEYAALKRELAARHRDDRLAYTEAKSGFVEAVLSRCRSEASR